jgi:hypothetical protein
MTKIQRTGLLAASVAVALCQGQQVRDTALKPLTFLSGRWVSEKATGVQEESWSPVSGDSGRLGGQVDENPRFTSTSAAGIGYCTVARRPRLQRPRLPTPLGPASPDYFLFADNSPGTQANGSSMSVFACSQ